MIFYDFEVFKYNWLLVAFDTVAWVEHVIVDSKEALQALYDAHKNDVWVGYNSRHYDQYILKAILCDFSPKEVNDYIILQRKDGWQFSKMLRNIPLNNYDVMPNPPVGLKTLEGFLGSNIKETEVPFDLNRRLTGDELQQTIKYCRHDVQQTFKVFLQKKADFDAQFGIIKAFKLPLSCIGDTEARITAKVLECSRRKSTDEFDWYFLPCLRLKKYRYVQDWFRRLREEARRIGLQHANDYEKKTWYKKQNLEITVAGIPHSFGFGGIHGATAKPKHFTGLILHVDVNNYYPSILIAWGLVTRAAGNRNYQEVYKTRKALKYKQKHAATKEEAKRYKKAQLPYKKMLNALSGAMKDATNTAYDPRNNNIMCINGQLMLLDLIEHLEVVPGFELIQSNTDGLIIRIPDTDEAFTIVDDICYEWEQRCSTSECDILLELDLIKEIYQKDVNNYLWVDADGGVERIGAYVKELSPIDNDLPIINRALVEYMVHKTPPEKTIRECDDLIEFQKIVKLSDKYKWVEHEHGGRVLRQSGVRKIRTWYEYTETKRYHYKSYRVFASCDPEDGRILKCGGSNPKPQKFGNTPDHCFVWNDSVEAVKCPPKLDKSWYINLAKKTPERLWGNIMNEILELSWNCGNGRAHINIDQFFPTTKTRIRKLLKLIEEDDFHSSAKEEHIEQIISFLGKRVDEDEAKREVISKNYWQHQQKYAEYRDRLADKKHPNGLPLTKSEMKTMKVEMRVEKKFMNECVRDAKKTDRRAKKTLENIHFIMEVTGNVVSGVCEDKREGRY